MSSLTLAMIVKDEASVIQRCLDSVQEACNEIILLDTGSSDATLALVQKYPQVKVHHFKWINDFGAARRESFKHATCELLLWLDADDLIYPADLEILKGIKNRTNHPDCYLSRHQYSHDAQGNVTTSHFRERIFKRSCNPTWKYRIHECVPLSQFKSTENSNFEVHHFKTDFHYKRSEGRNLKILKECVDDPQENCARYEFYYGKELSELGDPKAEIYLKRYLEHPDYWEDHYYALYRLAEGAFNKKQYDDAMRLCFDALKLDQRRAEVYCLLGLIYVNQQRWDLATFWYETALLMPRPTDSLGFFNLDHYTWIPHVQLTMIYNSMGKMGLAVEHAEKALKYKPTDPTVINNFKILSGFKSEPDNNPTRKIAIYIPFDYDPNNPNIRIRKLNIQKELIRQGYNCQIVKNYQELFNYDWILSHVILAPQELQKLKAQGKIIAYDYAEGVIDQSVSNELPKYSAVTTCSNKLKDYAESFNNNSVTIHDGFET